MKSTLRHTATGLIMALILAGGVPAGLTAQETESTTAENASNSRDYYISPFILGVALNLGIYTPFSAFGSIIVNPQLRLTSEFFFGGGDTPPDCSMTFGLGLDMLQNIFVEIGLEWDRQGGIPVKTPFGVFVGSGIDLGVGLRSIMIGCRWKPFATSRNLKTGETFVTSNLSPVTSASLTTESLANITNPADSEADAENGTGTTVSDFSSNIGLSLDILSVGIGINPYKDALKIQESADRVSENEAPAFSFFFGTGLHILPLMYFLMPLPFTEISAGVEFGTNTSAVSLTLHSNWVMTIADFYEALSLELTYCPVKIANWHPGITVGIDISKLAIFVLTGYDSYMLGMFYAGLDLLCFDFVLRNESRIRLSVVPLNSNSIPLLLGAPHVLTLLVVYWFF